MGILCSIVPILFCCQGKSRRSSMELAEAETGRAIRKSRGGTPMTPIEEMPQERRRSVPQEEEKIDQSAVIEQFREYVEQESSAAEEEKEETDISQ